MKVSQVLGLTVALALAACTHPKPPEAAVSAFDVRGVLVPTDKLAPPFTVQQRIHGKYAGGDSTMDCVVQLAKGKLTVLGLTPFGTRAFVIEQTGTKVRFEKFVDRDIPVQPESVLYDIHRVFFRGLPPPDGDGVFEAQEYGDMVRETWEDGHIVERRFESLEGPINNLVVVTYDGAPAPVIAPRVRITNAAYAYSLEIENTEQKTLAGEYTLEVETAAPATSAPGEAPATPPADTPAAPSVDAPNQVP